MRIEISKTSAKDFLEIAALDRIAWLDNNNATYIPDGEHIWRIWCEYNLVYKAVVGDKIIGVIQALVTETGLYCVHKAFVDKEFRGKGIGKLLFKALLEKLDQLNASSFLTVDPENKAAISLYKSWGYIIEKEVKGFYRANEDRFIMVRASVT